MKIDKNKHILSRVALVSAVVIMEESLREYLSPSAIWTRDKKGNINRTSEKYILSKVTKAISEMKKASSCLEKVMFAPDSQENAYSELYDVFALQQLSLLLTPENKEKAYSFMQELYNEQKLNTENETK